MENQVKRLTMIAALLAFGLFTAACSGSEPDSGVASLETQTDAAQDLEPSPDCAGVDEGVSDEESILAFAACLRAQGLDVEDPTVDADGNLRPPRPRDAGEEDLDLRHTAMEACSEHLDNVAFGLGAADRAEREDELLEYAACMRENGYDMPDPDFSAIGTPGPGAGGGPFGAIDRDDPAFQTAQDACADIFGTGSPIPGGGPGGGEG